MIRYSLITEGNFRREFVLLQGTGCRWKQCTFCDYHEDISDAPYEVNRPILEQVTGKYGVLDIINSGSGLELDPQTIGHIRRIVQERHIHTLWFEMHYMYRKRLKDFAQQFAPAEVKFRCGVESFDPTLRNLWKKGIPSSVTPEMIAEHFQGVCLLCCTDGDSKERILSDISIAREHFEYCSINLFCNNGTAVRRDDRLAEWFISEVYPAIKEEQKFEILLNNTDLGVG